MEEQQLRLDEFVKNQALNLIMHQQKMLSQYPPEVSEHVQRAANETFKHLLTLISKYEELSNVELQQGERIALAFMAYASASILIVATLDLISKGYPAAVAASIAAYTILDPDVVLSIAVQMKAFEMLNLAKAEEREKEGAE